eukprot:gnl/MRDRNA2_/MRDRNA2_49883_c0_seq2.p1 gnl/MRDRNA2_/MRDRNA2_49883_c0~~gnl/MRDRNA2_/MRDRNA2_49883_c0_seq2.p1  ORF type:complete len:511 (+),score=107.53 gnl/MRDRNA2_/MRDRNA2_49883_c0_seq2:78-1610(+)
MHTPQHWQLRQAPKPPQWAVEAEKGGVSDMRHVMAQMAQRQAIHNAEDMARKQADGNRAAPAPSRESAPVKTEEKKPEAKEEPEEEVVPKCHLHRKLNKACRFCKQHSAFLEKQTAKKEAAKQEVLKEIQDAAALGPEKVDRDNKVLLPYMAQFPEELKLRIMQHKIFEYQICDFFVADCEEKLPEDESCEIDTQREDMFFVPNSWIMCVYRLMILRPTEDEFDALLNHRSIWVRCAAYLIVRLGMTQDRYWELLSPGLMDNTEFKPFPKRDPRTYTMGEYVQKLLWEDKYCSEPLPRIPMGLRKTLNERLILYAQFRERYQANLEVLDRYEEPGVPVEVCREVDGEWVQAKTVGAKSRSKRCITTPVRFEDGKEQNVSIGRLIIVDPNADQTDLTKSRGRSNKELLEKYREEQKKGTWMGPEDAAKNRSKAALPNTFVGKSGKRRKSKEEEEEEDEENALQEAKKRRETQEREREMSQIMQKYLAAGSSSTGGSSSAGDIDAPDHMRLG